MPTANFARHFILLFAFRTVFASLNVPAPEFNSADTHNSTNKLIAVIDILARRNIVRLSVIVDAEASVFCERVTQALHVAAKGCVRTYKSDWNYSENPFSKVNILCFRRDDNFVSFAARTNTFVSSDAFNIVLVREESRLERVRVLLGSQHYIWPHTIFINDKFVKAIHPSHVSELTINDETSVRDLFGISNFRGRSLRVTQFSRIPEVTPTKTGFLGSSYNMVMTLAKYLNFTPIIANATDGERFGDFVNGRFTGALGDLVYNRTDMVMNGNFLQEPQSDLYWYTVPVNFEQVCLILPKAEKIPKYLTPFMCLSPNVWLILKITFVTVCCVHYASTRLGHAYLNFDEYGVSNSVLTTLSATINIPLTISRYRYPAVRVLLVCYLSFMYVLVSSFRASLVTSLTVPMYYEDVDSLAELKESGRLRGFRTYSRSILKSFRSIELKDDPILSELRKNVEYIGPNDRHIHDRGMSFLVRSLYSHAKFLYDFIIESAVNTVAFHRVRECPMSYYVAYLLPKKFPFVEEINMIITRAIESGLIGKWDSDLIKYSLTDKSALFKLRLIPPRAHVLKFDSQPMRFSMEHLQIAFYILLAGWSISVCVFLTEIARRRKKKVVAKTAPRNIRIVRKFPR